MKINSLRILLILLTLSILSSCKKNSGLENEVWPKEGYLFTTDSDSDTVFVESGNFAQTSPYSARFPLDDPEKKWTISLPISGEGVLIHNVEGEYWSIDSTFMPGVNVEQFYVTIRRTTDPSTLSEPSRFRYHKAGNNKSFYIESVYYPGLYVTGLGHAESGRGLRMVKQSSGIWEFWIGAN